MRRAPVFGVVTSLVLAANVAHADDAKEGAARASSPSGASPKVPPPRILAQPDGAYTYADPQLYPSLPWLALQLLPSFEVAVGKMPKLGYDVKKNETELRTTVGLRWQATPVLWSWGTNRHISGWRFFVVDPLARHSGSLELSTAFEYLFGRVDRALVRPGVRAYFPILHRGEYLSVSYGTSTYRYDDKMRIAHDVGVYALFGLFGLEVSVAPNHDPLTAIGTFRIRYF